MNISFDDKVFAYEVLDSRHFRATIPLDLSLPLSSTIDLTYSKSAPVVSGRVKGLIHDCTPEGHLTHLTVETDDLAGLLAAEATRNLAASA